MPSDHLAFLAFAIVAVAFFYSSVGMGGGTGYLAVMSLFGLAPEAMRPTALALNVLVASIGTWHFWRAGHFSWRLFWPFALLSVPFAFAGGALALPATVFKGVLGAVLLYSASRLFARPPSEDGVSEPPLPAALSCGAGLGLLSGLTGIGGGVFLAPLLIGMRWARAKAAAAVCAPFILVNSVAGLFGNIGSTRHFPMFALLLLAAAAAGGAAGAHFGSRRFPPIAVKRVLALLLGVVGARLLFAL